MREKLIELLQCSPTDIMGNRGVGALADHLISNGVTLATDNNVGCKWIPVTEQLPEECGRFLVYGSRGGTYTAEFRKFSDFGSEYPHWHKLNSKNHHCEPTHWMPLPEPPKGE